MRDFIEDHKGLSITLAVILGLVIILVIWRQVRISNGSFKSKDEPQQVVEEVTETLNTSIQEDVIEAPQSSYTASLGLNADKGDGRVEYKEPEKETETEKVEITPNYPTKVSIFDHTGVPKKNVDGSSYQDYLKRVSLADFGSKWGSKLTKKDKTTEKRILVGVEQDPNDYVKGDLQSTGWLINNIDNIKANTAIKFTNLHVIDDLATDHVALFCSYDWYSAFGLKDTMVVFEDISGTLSTKDFKNGDIFSCTVYGHNVKVKKVNGYNVVCLQYAVFE